MQNSCHKATAETLIRRLSKINSTFLLLAQVIKILIKFPFSIKFQAILLNIVSSLKEFSSKSSRFCTNMLKSLPRYFNNASCTCTVLALEGLIDVYVYVNNWKHQICMISAYSKNSSSSYRYIKVHKLASTRTLPHKQRLVVASVRLLSTGLQKVQNRR